MPSPDSPLIPLFIQQIPLTETDTLSLLVQLSCFLLNSPMETR
jgi:hypothetical protein